MSERATRLVRAWGAACSMLGAALLWSALWPLRPLLLWNASPSSTVGLYAVSPPGHLEVGDIVAAWAPDSARRLAAARGYLPVNVPLVKRVAAVGGDRVCARRDRIVIDGRTAALRRARDPSGRKLPQWSGCVRLRNSELFLLSSAPLAFDGRYFGITRAPQLIGKLRLLWPTPASRVRG